MPHTQRGLVKGEHRSLDLTIIRFSLPVTFVNILMEIIRDVKGVLISHAVVKIAAEMCSSGIRLA